MGNVAEILAKGLVKIGLGYIAYKIVKRVTDKGYDMTGSYKNWKLSISNPRKDKS